VNDMSKVVRFAKTRRGRDALAQMFKKGGDMKHTATPWESIKIGSPKVPKPTDYIIIKGDKGRAYIGGIDSDNETARVSGHEHKNDANAEFIVRACNAHDELLEAAKWALERIDPGRGGNLFTDLDGIRKLYTAIHHAEKEDE